jgi:hypothetical protein
MSLSRSFLALTAGCLLAAGFVFAHDHKKAEAAPVAAAAAGSAPTAASAPACSMPCCAHVSAPGGHCPMMDAQAGKGSAPASNCPCCGKAGAMAGSAPMACAHGSAPMDCAHHGSAAMASCAHGSAPMDCAHHDSAAMAADGSAPAAGGMKGCQGMMADEHASAAAPASAPAAAPAKPAAHVRKGDGVKSCPVSGEAVDPKVSAVINGRKVNFCCPDCIKEAEANPALYAGADSGVPAVKP